MRFWLLLAATYAVLLIVVGYRVYEDASIPLGSVALRFPEKLQKDFSLQGTATERLLVNYLYAPFVGRWGLFFGLHAAFSLLLLAGLWRLAHNLIGSEGWAWIALWTVLPVLYHHHWGSNELYYPYFTPSLPAKAMGAWVWVSLLEGRLAWAGLALAATTIIHPSVGWQTWAFSLPLVGGKNPPALRAEQSFHGSADWAPVSPGSPGPFAGSALAKNLYRVSHAHAFLPRALSPF